MKSENIFEASDTQIADFLTDKFNEGYEYASLNTQCSAISLILKNDITNSDTLKRLFRSFHRKRPPTAKYKSTWDPSTVLQYLKDWSPNNELNMEKLTRKTATLLALASAQRVHTLSLIKIANILDQPSKIIIKIPDHIKTSGINKYQPLITLPVLESQPEICAASALREYKTKT